MSANPPFYRSVRLREANLTEHPGLFELGSRCAGRARASRSGRAKPCRPRRHSEISSSSARSQRAAAGISWSRAARSENAGGDLMLLLAIDDITERRLLEASEKQARLEAEQANRAKDLFLATLSHELRTPLGTILMSAQLLQQTATQDPKIQRASAAIERAVGNQARLIDDLLDISRIVSGKLMLDLQAVDLTAVVAECGRRGADLGRSEGDSARARHPWLPPPRPR